jgi:hypothetical protein
MMRNATICLGIVLSLVLLYSSPVFAKSSNSEQSLGAKGLFSSREMHAVTNSGGTFASPNKSGSGGAPVAVYKTANGPVELNHKQFRQAIGDSFRSNPEGNTMRANAAAARQNGSTNSDYGFNRGHSDAMGAAVNQLRTQYPRPSVSQNGQINTGKIMVGGVEVMDEGTVPFMGPVATNYKTGPGQYMVGGKEVIDEGSVPFMGSTSPVQKQSVSTYSVATGKTNIGGSIYAPLHIPNSSANSATGKVNMGGNIYLPTSYNLNAVTGNRGN